MANADLVHIITSDKTQVALNLPQHTTSKYLCKKTPLVNKTTIWKLDAHGSWCENIGVYWSWERRPCEGNGAAALEKSR